MKTSGDETDQIAHHGLGKINIETNDNSKKKLIAKYKNINYNFADRK